MAATLGAVSGGSPTGPRWQEADVTLEGMTSQASANAVGQAWLIACIEATNALPALEKSSNPCLIKSSRAM